jgi:hypothetical protein
MLMRPKNLSRLVAHRFTNKANARIARGVQAIKTAAQAVENGGVRRAMTVPVDWGKVERLFTYIARGLAWFTSTSCSWVRIARFAASRSWVRTGDGSDTSSGSTRAGGSTGAFGQGTFRYRGAQTTDNPLITFWEFSVYGGIRTRSSGDAPHDIGLMTGPKHIWDRGRQIRDLLIRWRSGTRLHG